MKEQVQTNPAAGSEMTAKKTQHQKIVAMVQIALFAAIIAVCSWIQIPMTVPFTMQTFAVFCALASCAVSAFASIGARAVSRSFKSFRRITVR